MFVNFSPLGSTLFLVSVLGYASCLSYQRDGIALLVSRCWCCSYQPLHLPLIRQQNWLEAQQLSPVSWKPRREPRNCQGSVLETPAVFTELRWWGAVARLWELCHVETKIHHSSLRCSPEAWGSGRRGKPQFHSLFTLIHPSTSHHLAAKAAFQGQQREPPIQKRTSC